MATMLKAPSPGGASREVLFRLGVIADPGAAQQFKRFGDEVDRQQRRILDSTKARASQITNTWKSSADEAAKSFERLQNVGEASARRIGSAYRQAADSAKRSLAEVETAATGVSRAGAASRIGGAASGVATRMGGGISGETFSRIGQGGVLVGQAVALSGLLGEDDSQKLLDGLLKIAVISQGIKGGIDIISGVASLTGGGAGLTALLTGPLLPAIAAAAGGAVLIAAASENARDPGNSRPSFNGVSGTLPSAGERPSFWMRLQQNPFSDFTSQFTDPDAKVTSDVLDAADRSFRRVQSQQRAAGREVGENARRRGIDADIQGTRLEILSREKTIAEERLKIARDERMTALDTAKIRLSSGEQELTNAQRLLTTRQEEARSARERFQNDLERFADLDPTDRARLAGISNKVRSGGMLSAEESRLAGSFNEFRDAASRSNQARALAMGAGGIFTSGADAARRSAMLVSEAATAVSRAELTVRREQELVIRLEKVPENEQQWQREITVAAKRALEISQRNEMTIDELRKQLLQKEQYRRTLNQGR